MKRRPKPLILTILDGWGFSPTVEGNAIAAARKPNYDKLLREYPNSLIHTSGPYVGLPTGQMGNSEVGHLNIGAGRIIHMDVTRIDLLVQSGEFFSHPVLLDSMRHARPRRLHLMGLLSDGGVHSSKQHLYALLKLARQEGVSDVCIHCFMDGRDTPPQSGAGFIRELQQQMQTIGTGRIASVSGRYYAMDRDKRWERIDRAFGAMVRGDGFRTSDPETAVNQSYEHGVTDEFIEPLTVFSGHTATGLLRDEDACIFFNYRADRAREMSLALTDSKLALPSRSATPRNLHFTTLTQYDKTFSCPFVIPPEHPDHILANVFAQANLKNLRIAETEKYAHVTYFFNGGKEESFSGESREMIPSPKVATYDLKPEMSAGSITETVVNAIESASFDVIVMNFANADMVGHSGKMEPTVKAVEAVDGCLGEIYKVLQRRDGAWVISADHGNAETMIDPITHGPHTYHTTNPVPLIVVAGEPRRALRENGSLRDIAPTILGLLGLEQPRDMTGSDLRTAPRDNGG